MDPCAQLRRDLRDAVAERDREMDRARRRFWLGLLGLEFVLDWEERTTIDRGISVFLAMVQAGEILLAVQGLATLLGGVARRSGSVVASRMIGRWAGRALGAVALGMLALDIMAGWARWEREESAIGSRFRTRISELLEQTHCENPEAILREEGVPVP
jgi:hypothetical protein